MSLDAIGVASRDIRESKRFYQILGVDLAEQGGPDHYEGMTPSGVRIMVDSFDLMKKINPAWQEPVGCGVILCFKMDSPGKVNEMFAKFRDAGFKSVKDPWDAFWGQRYASVSDPDGNQVDLFAPL